MHIYFINRKSTLGGPFDITDSHRHRIMKVGDVVIRESEHGLSFLLVVSDINRWNACKCVGQVYGNISIESNTLLFKFDGISQRFGNNTIIRELKELFDEPPLCYFFDNALLILDYKCDLWDINIYYQIHSMSPIELSENTNIVQSTGLVKESTTGYLFEKYLNTKTLCLFYQLVDNESPMREVYKEIKRQFPKDFRQALMEFQNDHPNSTIYDKY